MRAGEKFVVTELLVKEPADIVGASCCDGRVPAYHQHRAARGRRHGLVLPAWTICHKAGGNGLLALGMPPEAIKVPSCRASPSASCQEHLLLCSLDAAGVKAAGTAWQRLQR